MRERDPHAPVIAEVVGPAGAGKTALLAELQRRCDFVTPVAGYREVGHASSHVRVYARSAVSSVPVVLGSLASSRGSGKELKWMIRLAASQRVAEHRVARRSKTERRASSRGGPAAPVAERRVAVFDQGPAYVLARLWERAPAGSRGRTFKRWWDGELDRWARTLRVAVMLDAPDYVLVERIRSRVKSHAAKGLSEAEAVRAVAGSRASYEATLAALAARGGPEVLRFDSSLHSVEEIAGRVAVALRAAVETDGGPPRLANTGTVSR
jgi:hypothetical protein